MSEHMYFAPWSLQFQTHLMFSLQAFFISSCWAVASLVLSCRVMEVLEAQMQEQIIPNWMHLVPFIPPLA